MNKWEKIWARVNKKTFIPPAVFLVIILMIGIVVPQQLGDTMDRLLSWLTTNFGWFYALGATLLVGVAIWICFSKYGKIKFGGKDAQPEMSTFRWFCIVMTSGMAAGICYYAVAEPLSFFENPPVFSGAAGGSIEAAEQALQYVFLHWTLHPYAIYVVVGLACGFMYWNAKKPFSVASGLYPLLGEKVMGTPRHWINALAVFALVCGVGTSLGLSVDQITVGLNYVFHQNLDPNIVGIFICLGFAVISIAAASSGLHKGISYISSANMYMFFFLMVFVLIFGGVRFIMNNTVSSLGKYFSTVVEQSLYVEPAYQSGWVNNWTIFYWAWWIVFAPLVGLFQIKLAKGRTVRQFILVNMFAPSLFLVFWFGIFGGAVINLGLSGITTVSEVFNELGTSVALFAFLKEFPLAWVLILVAFAAIIFSVLTMTEAEVMTIADLCVKNEKLEAVEEDGRLETVDEAEVVESDLKSPLFLKIFWGLTMCLLAFILLYSGGLDAVQTASVVLGFPILILLLLMAISLIKGLRNYKKYDRTLGPEEDYDE